jgi:hypothetical protein
LSGVADQTATLDWTCNRCEVTVSWMAEVERPELPATWIEQDGELYCLACRRDMAGEAGIAAAPDDATQDDLSRIKSRARIAFELQRKPDREDNRIAKACNTSIDAVRKERARLGLQSRTSG